MTKVFGIVLLVLVLSLVSVPAFAQQVELDLKLWYPGVVGADEWVADYGTYEVEEYPNGLLTLQWEPPPHKDENELVLQPGSGLSFILSGEYFILPSISVGGSYWGISRVDEVDVELESEYMFFSSSATTTLNGDPEWYWIKLPWFEDEFLVWQKAGLAGKETLSMSALDGYVTKTFSGQGWEAGLSGGVRRATFNERLSTELDLIEEDEGEYEVGGDYYREWWGYRSSYDLSSKVSVSATGPLVGINGTYALADRLALKAGAKAGLLFGTAETDATLAYESWYYEYTEEIPNSEGFHVTPAQAEEASYEWELLFSEEVPPHKATDAIRITTLDLSAALAYQITDQWSVEAGYYAAILTGVPSLFQFNGDEYIWFDIAEDGDNGDPIPWEQPEARTITVRGLTLGVNFKF